MTPHLSICGARCSHDGHAAQNTWHAEGDVYLSGDRTSYQQQLWQPLIQLLLQNRESVL